jgi:hypothetical protein
VTNAEAPRCSAKGCRRAAHWVLVWNNPKIHPPDREKRWLGCEEHRGTLASFLDARGFLRRIDPLPPGSEPADP